MSMDPNTVFCSSVDVTLHRSRSDDLLALLSEEECARGIKLVSPLHRELWLLGRGLLKEALAGILFVPPRQIQLVISPSGKPRLEGASRLEFNLSHSGDRLFLAWSLSLPMGADLERIDPGFNWRSVAHEALKPGEIQALESLGDEARKVEAFYRIWCAKEAALKVAGGGIPEIGACLPIRLIDENKQELLSGIWAKAADVGSRHAASVAAPGADWSLIQTEWGNI